MTLSARTQPLVIGLVLAELLLTAGVEARVPGTGRALDVIVLVALPVGGAIAWHCRRVRNRLLPEYSTWTLRRRCGDLLRRLEAGGPIAPEERALAGRIAWWELADDTGSTWSLTSLGGVHLLSSASGGDRFAGVAGALSLGIAVLLPLVVVISGRRTRTWRRIAEDTALVDPPVVPR